MQNTKINTQATALQVQNLNLAIAKELAKLAQLSYSEAVEYAQYWDFLRKDRNTTKDTKKDFLGSLFCLNEVARVRTKQA